VYQGDEFAARPAAPKPPKGPDHGFRIRAAPNVAMGKAA
jgi:hypothetical protein